MSAEAEFGGGVEMISAKAEFGGVVESIVAEEVLADVLCRVVDFLGWVDD